MHRPRFRRWFLACACMAMCLVIGAPLLSRALNHAPVPAPVAIEVMAHEGHHGAAHAGHGSATPHAEMNAHAAHRHAAHAAAEERPSPALDPHADHEMGVECDYCLIAVRLISLMVAVLLLLTLWASVLRPLLGLATTRLLHLAGTLGARGPPALYFA